MLNTSVCAVGAVFLVFCEAARHGWRHRRERRAAAVREWAVHVANFRNWEARSCPHDSGDRVDEAEWAEIVERLRGTSSR